MWGQEQGQQLPDIFLAFFAAYSLCEDLAFFKKGKIRKITVSRTLQGEKKHSVKCTYQAVMRNT